MTKSVDHELAERYEAVVEKIEKILRSAQRSLGSVKLVVVTKQQEPEILQALIRLGIVDFGENYPDETIQKIHALGHTNTAVRWHMIGHLQSRKAPLVAQHFAMMHSLDRLSCAEKLNSALKKLGQKLPVLLQFNVSGEISKGGWEAVDPSGWTDLCPVLEALQNLPHLEICGLMTMPPYSANPSDSRSYYQKLRHLRDYFASEYPHLQLNELSIGTSLDYEIALQEGATFVRIGEAIVGKREQ